MPNQDGKGPRQGSGRRMQGRSKQCTCPKCAHKMPHKKGIPCSEEKCPKCGTIMKGDFCL